MLFKMIQNLYSLLIAPSPEERDSTEMMGSAVLSNKSPSELAMVSFKDCATASPSDSDADSTSKSDWLSRVGKRISVRKDWP